MATFRCERARVPDRAKTAAEVRGWVGWWRGQRGEGGGRCTHGDVVVAGGGGRGADFMVGGGEEGARGDAAREWGVAVDVELEEVEEFIRYEGDGAVYVFMEGQRWCVVDGVGEGDEVKLPFSTPK